LANKNDDTFSAEVVDRLSDFFSESSPSENLTKDINTSKSHEFPFTRLKAILLSIEWEISDDILNKLLHEINRLIEIYQQDKILFSFLQLHGSVGKYIRAKKVTAHPDSINLLHSIYANLEKVAQSPSMGEEQKRQILSGEVEKFKALKEQILLAKKTKGPADTAKTSAPKDSDAVDPGTSPPPMSQAIPKTTPEQMDLIVGEITKVIKAEFEALRQEIKLLIKK
jgi:hypothetical protein